MKSPDRRFIGRWLWACFLGWFLGFVLVVVLAVVADIAGGGAQFMIGVGMGAGVGLAQARSLRPWLAAPRNWWIASTSGLGLPFVVHDLLGLAGLATPYSLPAYAVAGALLVGLLQWRLLRPLSRRAGWWIPACVVGWSLPVGAVALGDPGLLPEPWRTILSLVGMLLGGLLLGTVSGPSLATILPNREPGAP
jgi:hypothetical protein